MRGLSRSNTWKSCCFQKCRTHTRVATVLLVISVIMHYWTCRFFLILTSLLFNADHKLLEWVRVWVTVWQHRLHTYEILHLTVKYSITDKRFIVQVAYELWLNDAKCLICPEPAPEAAREWSQEAPHGERRGRSSSAAHPIWWSVLSHGEKRRRFER